MRNFINAALVGALTFGTANLAIADRDHGRRHDDDRYESRYRDDERVLDTKRLRSTRGRVELDVTPGLRRDGLMLVTDGRIGIRKVQFVYDDGQVVTLKGRRLAAMPQDTGSITIQTGRPGGLRHVRVWYSLASRERSAQLQLVSYGDGYTDEDDRREHRPRRRDRD